MAGRGTRLRPHTLTVPKPLIGLAGKEMVAHLVEDIVAVCDIEKVENIGFVIGNFGKQVEERLLYIAESVGANGSIFYQHQALGTAHAILQAQSLLNGETVIAFADTLFKANFSINPKTDGTIWVHEVDDPSNYGVVKLNDKNIITQFIEKPPTPLSKLAIIGIYYFKDGNNLKNELQYLIDNNIQDKGEYQITTALENMKQKGAQLSIAKVTEWWDCGNKNAAIYANQRLLSTKLENNFIHDTANIIHAQIIAPCYIGANTQIKNAIIGQHTTIGNNCIIENCIISNSIIQNNTQISNTVITNSMIGSHVKLPAKATILNIGDYTEID